MFMYECTVCMEVCMYVLFCGNHGGIKKETFLIRVRSSGDDYNDAVNFGIHSVTAGFKGSTGVCYLSHIV